MTAKVPAPWTLQLVKSGSQYFARAKASPQDAAWIETPHVTVLRQMGNLILFATQTQKVDGETAFEFDRMSINDR